MFRTWRLPAAVVALAAVALSQSENRWTLSRAEFLDRMRGGWVGQMIGVSYGAPYEFRALGSTLDEALRAWEPEFLHNAIQQDDLYVEMTWLAVLDRHGPAATAEQAGLAFRDTGYRLWHANDAARENLRQGILPPDSGHPRYNPHADDIDFQIEADVFGLVSPGMPAAAARLCDAFGSVMCWGDGLYGGRFVATMYARAYREPDASPAAVRRCVEDGLRAVHPDSDYAKALRQVLDGFDAWPDDWRRTWAALEDRWAESDLCPEGRNRPFDIDAKLNGAYIAIGLLYGGGDLGRTLEITTRCGQDADCNPSNAAGVLGTLLGLSRIPAEYRAALDEVAPRRFEHTDYDFERLVATSARVARAVLLAADGRVDAGTDGEVWRIPEQRVEPPAGLQQMRTFGDDDLAEWAVDFQRRRARAFVARLALPGWAEGWRLVACGTEMNPGVHAVLGRDDVLVTHPVGRDEPAALEHTLTVPAGVTALAVTVASHPSREEADWLLRFSIDGELCAEHVVRRDDGWRRIEFDLSAHAGDKVLLRLENAGGGAHAWAWEAACWAGVELVRR